MYKLNVCPAALSLGICVPSQRVLAPNEDLKTAKKQRHKTQCLEHAAAEISMSNLLATVLQ